MVVRRGRCCDPFGRISSSGPAETVQSSLDALRPSPARDRESTYYVHYLFPRSVTHRTFDARLRKATIDLRIRFDAKQLLDTPRPPGSTRGRYEKSVLGE